MANKSGTPRTAAQEAAAQISRYRAPALEKGLDVIELLAAEKSPLNLSAISQRLGRSSGELFRMLQVLEFKGFITTAENGSGYVLTNKLFALAMAQAPVRSLVETALPIMRKLVQDIGQSAHIAVASEDQIVVITRIERPGDLGFSVRIGYRREIASATSGLVLFAYQNDEVRRVWLKRCRLKGDAADSFVERANIVRDAWLSRSRVALRARDRRLVRAHPARRHRGGGAHHSLRSQQSTAGGNAAGSGVRARGGQTDLERNRARRPSMTRDDDGRQRPRAFITPGYLFATVLIVGLFFMWGVANSLNDVLIPQFRKAFQLDDFASSLVQSAFYFGYFCFAIPASLFMRRFGYRAAVLMGLGLYGAGALLFLPAAQASQYYGFLIALYVIASGLAFLETSANPLIAVMGPASSADQRLNFAQTFNPIGTMMGSYVGGMLIFSDVHYTRGPVAGADARSICRVPCVRARRGQTTLHPHRRHGAGLGCAGRLREIPAGRSRPRRAMAKPKAASPASRKFPRYWLGVLAQFAYVGAQVGVWSFLIRYTQHNFPGTLEKDALRWLPISFGIFFAGRFIGTLLMSRVNPAKLLASFAAINVTLCVVAVVAGGHVGLTALIASSFFMSIMFPTIFSMSLRGLGVYTKSGSSFLVMAIIGGAVFTAAMGFISRESSINIAYLVPALCFAIVFLFAWKSRQAAA